MQVCVRKKTQALISFLRGRGIGLQLSKLRFSRRLQSTRFLITFPTQCNFPGDFYVVDLYVHCRIVSFWRVFHGQAWYYDGNFCIFGTDHPCDNQVQLPKTAFYNRNLRIFGDFPLWKRLRFTHIA